MPAVQAKKRKKIKDKKWSLSVQNKNIYYKLVITIIISVFCYQIMVAILSKPVRYISIESSFQQVKVNQIQEVVTSDLDNGFLRLDIPRIHSRILNMPWVDRVLITRKWPSKLELKIYEHIPVARWGESGLLNNRGVLFVEIDNPNHIPSDLAYLNGPDDSSLEVAERYFYLLDHLIPLGMNVQEISKSARGAWLIKLYNGIEVNFGKENLNERFDSFIDIAKDVLSQDSERIESVDMRYDKGFTLLLKKEN